MKALIDGEPPLLKRCGVCSTIKLLKDFATNSACLHGKSGTCKECVNTRSRKHYQDNKSHKLELTNLRNQRQKKQAIDYLGGSCQDCGGIFHPCAYDFHHVDGTKEVNPSKALTWSWDRAVEELDKCVLLCANCHRVRHFDKGGNEG